MRKTSLFWLILLSASFSAEIFSVFAVTRTYDWSTYENTHYTINVIVEKPQFDSEFDVIIQMTLISKAYNFDYARTKWMQVLLSSSEKPLQEDSGQLNETATLSNIGDSVQKVFHFQISSSQYGVSRGQGFAVSVAYRISIDEMDTIDRRFFNHTGDSVNDPLMIQLAIPWLWPVEMIIVVAIVTVVAVVAARSIYLEMRHRKLEKEQKLQLEAKEKRKEAMLVDNLECPFCHTLYDKKLAKCPTCGAAKKIRQ